MQGSAAVIQALNAVYSNTLALEQSAHLQEHYFEAKHYSFSKWWDKIETGGHETLIHNLMDRINQLGGKVLTSYAWAPDYTEDIGPAMTMVLANLQVVHTAYNQACDIAEASDDYVTEGMIWDHLKWLEKRMTKFESRIEQLKKVGEKVFLAEFI